MAPSMLRDCDVGAHTYQRADLRDGAAVIGARRAAEGGGAARTSGSTITGSLGSAAVALSLSTRD